MQHQLVSIYLLLIAPITFSWWAVGSQLLVDPHAMCARKRHSKRMQELCGDRGLLASIGRGVRVAQDECEWQFRHRRWNCTLAKRSMRKVLLHDTRETGFVNAILAAGVAYAVTRACTTGELLRCACERTATWQRRRPGTIAGEDDAIWQWSGCSENIHYGVRKSKDFLDHHRGGGSGGGKNDIRTLVKQHNYAAGRTAIKRHMRTQCKCHGLSGSCTMHTCWRRMPAFREVGDRLRDHFDGAARVIPGNDGHSFAPAAAAYKPPGRSDIVYLEESGRYCVANASTGSPGTAGRRCNATSLAEEGCDILCCGRGYRTHRERTAVRCECAFRWCCEVVCKQCERAYDVHTCL